MLAGFVGNCRNCRDLSMEVLDHVHKTARNHSWLVRILDEGVIYGRRGQGANTHSWKPLTENRIPSAPTTVLRKQMGRVAHWTQASLKPRGRGGVSASPVVHCAAASVRLGGGGGGVHCTALVACSTAAGWNVNCKRFSGPREEVELAFCWPLAKSWYIDVTGGSQTQDQAGGNGGVLNIFWDHYVPTKYQRRTNWRCLKVLGGQKKLSGPLCWSTKKKFGRVHGRSLVTCISSSHAAPTKL